MNDTPEFALRPVAFVRATRDAIRDDDWGDERATLILAPELPEEALRGLDAFSHLEVVFLFDRVDPDSVERGSRHPRGRSDWPRVGIFAQRGKRRPNRLGVSRCELLSVSGRSLEVRGLDAIDGTPILDIKPWMEEFGPRGATRQPDWSRALMAHYYDLRGSASIEPSSASTGVAVRDERE